MSQLDLKIGPKIKAFRRQLGLQANKIAEELNISPSYLNLIEGGKRKIDFFTKAFLKDHKTENLQTLSNCYSKHPLSNGQIWYSIPHGEIPGSKNSKIIFLRFSG